MVCIISVEVFYTKVINCYIECNWVSGVAPHARCGFERHITVPCQVLVIARVPECMLLWAHTCLFGFQNIHNPWNQSNPVLSCTLWALLRIQVIQCKVVLYEHFCWNIPMVTKHILVTLHGGVKKAFFYVCHAITSTLVSIWYYVIDMYFCMKYAKCWWPNILVGIEYHTTYTHSDSVNFSFVWAHGTYKITVGDLASWVHLRSFDEEKCVVTTDLFMCFVMLAKSCGTSVNFFCKWFLQDGLVFTH